MEDTKYFQMFLYSLVNLISFLLSVIFLTSLSNIVNQTKLTGLNDMYDSNSYSRDKYDKYKSYHNSYIGISVLFSFCFFGFLGFMAILMIIVKQYKINWVDKERMKKIFQPSTDNENKTGEDSDEKMRNYVQQNTINVILGEKTISIDFLRKIMIFFYIYCQGIYLIEVMVLTAYFSVAKDLEKDFKKELRYEGGKFYTRIYRDLITVGYIFLVLFIVFDLYTLILACGKKRRNSVRMKKESFKEDSEVFCLFFSDCITKCCDKMADTFSECEREGEDVVKRKQREKERLEEKIVVLETYLKDLEGMNKKIEGKKIVGKDELEKLNLPTTDTEMITLRFNLPTKK